MLGPTPQVSQLPFLILFNDLWTCSSCRLRTSNWRPRHLPTYRRQISSDNNNHSSPSKQLPPHTERPKEKVGEDGKKVLKALKTLGRPLGQPAPPQAGENSGIDSRSWRQRRDDFLDRDKYLERQKLLVTTFSKPYFRDWAGMNKHRGKTFIAPTRLIRGERAGHFPNLQGYTLENPGGVADTTNVLRGRISIVSLFCGKWANDQVKTFVAENTDLFSSGETIGASREKKAGYGKAPVQRVEVNIEEKLMRATLLRLSVGALKRMRPASEWGRYFIIRRGLTASVREHLGMANGMVGYVYLVDELCRIRWAGCGDATKEEKDSLMKLARRLVEGGGMKRGENEVALGVKVQESPGTRERIAAGAGR
ncbi:Mitochondrial ATPase complex subunit atp10 [Pseudocyphellaria aurata]|nr:Mitochondrial ATPase complex subunit atp10 [Pseudocyphellaria aurata]